MLKYIFQMYANITTEAVELYKSYYLVCQEKRKRPRTTGVVVKPILSSEFNASVPLGIFASAMVKCIIIHVMLPDALRF